MTVYHWSIQGCILETDLFLSCLCTWEKWACLPSLWPPLADRSPVPTFWYRAGSLTAAVRPPWRLDVRARVRLLDLYLQPMPWCPPRNWLEGCRLDKIICWMSLGKGHCPGCCIYKCPHTHRGLCVRAACLLFGSPSLLRGLNHDITVMASQISKCDCWEECLL